MRRRPWQWTLLVSITNGYGGFYISRSLGGYWISLGWVGVAVVSLRGSVLIDMGVQQYMDECEADND